MLRFVIRRILWMVPVLLSILVIVFLLMHAMPGGPWENSRTDQRALTNIGVDPKTIDALSRRFGLDEPLWKQFISYVIGRSDTDGQFICGMLCGNLGPSYRQRGRSVQEILFSPPKGKTFFQSQFGYSLRLTLYAFTFSLALSLFLGITAALRYNTWVDYAIKTFMTLFISMPNFVIGLLLILLLSSDLHLIVIIPTTWDTFDPRVWLLPILILGIGTLASFTRLTRASILEVIRKDYIRTARAKGAKERRVVYRHILKNALIPLVTYSGPALLELFAGSFVIETMFSYPGMGRQYINAAVSRDYSMILGVTLIYALLIAGVNILVDLLYGWIDPRIRVN